MYVMTVLAHCKTSPVSSRGIEEKQNCVMNCDSALLNPEGLVCAILLDMDELTKLYL